jgi:lipoyl(octanoyl) transferase
MKAKNKVLLGELGSVPYLTALDLQNRLHQKRVNNEIADILLLVEHPPVITIGKSGDEKNILFSEELLHQRGIQVVHIKRGGDVTYHGPGQVVGYPIFHILNHGKGVRDFVTGVEEVFIHLLREYYQIEARRDKQYTGVWVGDEKVVVRKFVSMHGFAFNVTTDLTQFRWINPCGIIGKGVTSLAKLIGYEPNMVQVFDQIRVSMEHVFNIRMEDTSKEIVFKLAETIP